MTEPEKEYIEDNSAMVNTIILWRIYDVLLLMYREMNPENAAKLAAMHEVGKFAGPNPAYKEQTDE